VQNSVDDNLLIEVEKCQFVPSFRSGKSAQVAKDSQQETKIDYE